MDWTSICCTIVTSATTAGRPSGPPPSESSGRHSGLGPVFRVIASPSPVPWRPPHSRLTTDSAPRGSHLFSAEVWSAPPPFPGPDGAQRQHHGTTGAPCGQETVSAWAVEPGGLGVALRARVDSDSSIPSHVSGSPASKGTDVLAMHPFGFPAGFLQGPGCDLGRAVVMALGKDKGRARGTWGSPPFKTRTTVTQSAGTRKLQLG